LEKQNARQNNANSTIHSKIIMEIPDYQRFTISDMAQLRAELDRLELNIPVDEDLSILSSPVPLGCTQISNRIAIQPMEGGDALPDGSPGPRTHRRYTRYAEGGAGLIWVEATAIEPAAASRTGQLCLHEDNVQAFTDLVEGMRRGAAHGAGHDVIILLQLAHGGRLCSPTPVIVHHNPLLDMDSRIDASAPLASDADLEQIRDEFIAAARLAEAAGFDGVDIKTCHNDLLSELLGARTREGTYGGSFENRIQLLMDVLAGIRIQAPNLLVATRMGAYDANPYPYGFGVSRDDPQVADVGEPIRLASLLADAGVSILNVSPTGPRRDGAAQAPSPADADIREVARRIALTRAIQEAVPGTIVVGGDISWFRQFAPQVASGINNHGGATIMGLGRAALAYPDAMFDILKSGAITPEKTCMLCGACIQLLRDGAPAGCVIRDPTTYGADYRHQRQFSLDHLRDEARRCHECEAAPCTAACPNNIDVPSFIKAFEQDDIPRAYAILQKHNDLPEMCAHLCPGWLLCEGACIEATLTGTPIPIRDIQYAVSWMARQETDIGIQLPSVPGRSRIAIVGGGPTGLSAAAQLARKGHRISLFERNEQLGGTPEATIPGTRYPGARLEIEARLRPAIETGRIDIQYAHGLGPDLSLDDLRAEYDAVLLAVGLWQQDALTADPPVGVVDALTFLAHAKQGKLESLPTRVAILSGGDCAMDSAREAQRLGATDIYIVYRGAMADMHWHMNPEWTTSRGVHLMTLTEPVGYTVDASGAITGLQCHRTDVPQGAAFELPVEMVIEAMGLKVANQVRQAMPGITFTQEGLIETRAESPFSTVLAGVFAAGSVLNGGATVAQCIAEGMRAADEIDHYLKKEKADVP